jgi:pimeloyl-ACP methyl ester carboxylesterase
MEMAARPVVQPRPERIPDARFRRVPGSGHLMQEDAPEAIVGELLDFIR